MCQSSDAAFHCLMSSGVVQARQTFSMGAATVVSMLMFMCDASYLVVRVRRGLTSMRGLWHGKARTVLRIGRDGPDRLLHATANKATNH